MKLTKYTLYCAFLSFFSAWAMVKACNISTFHPFGLIFYLFLFLISARFFSMEKTMAGEKKYRLVSAVISFLFTFFYFCAEYDTLFNGLENRLFLLMHSGIVALGLFFLFYLLVLGFFTFSKDWNIFLQISVNFSLTSGKKEKLFPFFCFLTCLICWFPYLAVNYPGVMTVDSLNQYGQIIGELPYNNHHPWIHTQLIRFFFQIGLFITHSPITGLAFFTFFQMIVMAAVFSYVMATLQKLSVKKWLCFCILAFYAILPYNGIYMVTMWKDILFSGMTVLFTTTLLRFLFLSYTSGAGNKINSTLYILSGICMCLFRSNGFYAFLITMPFLLWHFRKDIKKHMFLNFIIVFTVLIVKIPVMNSFQIAQPDFVESLSIPIQLASRVYAEEQPVNREDEEMWSLIVDTSSIKDTYYPYCSDHMKNLIRLGNQEYLVNHKKEYLALWIRFGLEHPGSYFRGYIDATKGYWYPDVPNVIGSDERIAKNDYGLTAKPFFHNQATIKIKEIIFKLPDMVPLYGLLFSLGFGFWTAILLAGKTISDEHSDRLILFLPNAAIMATLFLATPVYNEFRYGYPLLLTIPLFIIAVFCPDSVKI